MNMTKPLLSKNNFKTIKGESTREIKYITYILYMSPYKDNSKRINVCSHASEGCIKSCLVGSGFGGLYSNVKEGRRNRTEMFLRDREGFLNKLRGEIEGLIKKHSGEGELCIRLNGTSDISYEKFKVFEGKNIFEIFPDIQFYDYTKNWTRFDKELPSNYHLTFSRSETNHNKAMELLSRGINVAFVFDRLNKFYEGYEVINGDYDDLRFLDKRGVIVGLKYKKLTSKGSDNENGFKSGFVIKMEGV